MSSVRASEAMPPAGGARGDHALDRMAAKLGRQAAELAGEGLPVDIRAVRLRLGLGLTVEPGSGLHGGLRWEGGPRRGVVCDDPAAPRPPPQHRFPVAHEIGHPLGDPLWGFPPATESDYWRLEAVCDDFAGR